mgnify:CR=1 FL=1
MNFNDMKIFVTIYETKSINKSSKILQYAQSNLSARLKVIETELGCKLFLRNYNGLVPTEKGDLFYQFCKETSNNLENLKKRISKAKVTVLISELLLNHDINNLHTIDLGISDITIKKTSEIPSVTQQEDFDKILPEKETPQLNTRSESDVGLTPVISTLWEATDEESIALTRLRAAWTTLTLQNIYILSE